MSEAITVEVLDPIKFEEGEEGQAAVVKLEIDLLLDEIRRHEQGLSNNWMLLGVALLNVRSKKYWHLWGFPTFSRYIETLKDRVSKGRTQLYQYIGIVEKLLPNGVTTDQLVKMGPSKASELKRVVSETGRNPSIEVIEKAVDEDVTIQDLRATLFEEYHLKSEHPGSYFDVGGFYATADEKKEILEAFDVAAKTDPVIQENIPAWARLKEIVLRMCREFVGTYAAAVSVGQA